ncbi:hypothetical protein QYE76_016787 [Lolium multiflorum]|uniref:Retrotransposon gag domain-containing protein n=1 Tax=Lolium multiflorum TaxID=4521 RepID=A0AAD8PIR8_LOLMU|nr:hypothetical protein QYE76_016787 [Lolium multiflorum]
MKERFEHFDLLSQDPHQPAVPPVLGHRVDHLDFMLFETRAELDNSRSAAIHTQDQLNKYAETIKVIAKERRTLRQLVVKRDSTIHRLKAKIAVLKETIATQAEQLQILEGEGEGEDIQGDGYSYMAPPTRSTNQDAMLQMLQMMMADREVERAERQANLVVLQQLAQNNQGHGHQDHPGSKLKNQNTNPPVFSKTEEPLDADDWLQTMENNLEVAGVEDNEKVLFATHYLAGPARAWWTSTRALHAGQMMTWEDFKLKFSKYHVPPGLIKKMRDEFRELKQGRMTVVEYRDKFLTLSRYAPDETDTVEKRKERFLNGLHDEMQTVLINIPFADLEALVDSAIQMEGKIHQANENRKRRMMNQSGPSNNHKYRPSSSGGFAPRNNKPPMQNPRPSYQNRSGGNPRPGGHHNYNNNNNFNRAPPRAPNNNSNTAPRTGNSDSHHPQGQVHLQAPI